MRYLGIDYGKKRIGTALSDEEGRLAFPMVVLQNTGFSAVVKKIEKIAKKEGVSKIVIGLPMTFGGQVSEQTRNVKEFGEKLAGLLQLPMEYENEVLSTKMAERGETVNEHIDSASAAIILQSYLDKQQQKSKNKSQNE